MFAKMRKAEERGDTIVEVLIAIAVAASVLGVGLSTMDRNLTATRNNQERIQAVKLIQGQVELIKAAKDTSVTLPAAGVTFCMDTATSFETISGGNPHSNPQDDSLNDYNDCGKVDNNFYLAVKESTSEEGLFTFTARWEQQSREQRGTAEMVYKL